MRQKIKNFGKGTFASLKIRNYRLYFIGQGISLSGTWMQTIAQAWLVLQLTHSGAALGLVTAAQTLPVLLFGPWGGLIADRFPKRKILYVTQTTAGLLALTMGILALTGLIQVWMVFILATFLGMVTVIDNPTRQTFLREMVGKDLFKNAVSLNSSEFNLTRMIGPAIAGLLIATLGIPLCFIINGLSYIAVLVVLYMMKVHELESGSLVPKAKGQLFEGFRYVKSNPILKNTLIMMAVIGTLSYEFQVSLPLLAQVTFAGNVGSYAAMSSALGFGSVIGGLFSARRHTVAPHMLIRAAILFGAAMVLAALMPSLILTIGVLVIVGFFSINFATMGNVTLQMESAEEMRGRVMALWTVAFLGSTPIGGPIIGWIGQTIGPRWGLIVGGSAAVGAATFGTLSLKADFLQVIPLPVFLRSEQGPSAKEDAGAL